MKKYITKNFCYHNKLGLNKASTIEQVISSYNNFYNNKYTKITLKFNDNHFFYINWEILTPLSIKFFELSDSVDKLRTKQEKIFSSTKHEIFNNLLIESYSSSRKYIEDVMNNKRVEQNNDKMADNILRAMNYILEARIINHNNLNYLYQTLTNDIEMHNNTLDGNYYRLDNVSIGTNHGVDSKCVNSFMNDLIDYINSDADEEDRNKQLIKIIICHYYFEFIHPYYDFNGRTGRILVLWMSIHKGLYDELAFFSTALVAYRDKYLKLFKINPESNNIDLTYFVANIIEILINQKIHYQKVIKVEKEINKKFKVNLSSIQRDILIWDQSHRDIYNLDDESNIKVSLIINNYKEYSKQHIYNEINKLQEYGIITITDNRKNKLYKLNLKKIIVD